MTDNVRGHQANECHFQLNLRQTTLTDGAQWERYGEKTEVYIYSQIHKYIFKLDAKQFMKHYIFGNRIVKKNT